MNDVVRVVALAELVDLRHRVLRAGLPRETAVFPGDELATTRHLAALDDAGKIVGCLSLHLNEYNGEKAYQVRGMATEENTRGKGTGRMMMEAAEFFVRTAEVRVMWCNARKGAIGFYTRMGWGIMSAEFDIPTAGPHVVMMKRLE